MRNKGNYSGKVYYSWLISFLIIFSIPILLSVLLQIHVERMLKGELYNLGSRYVMQMKSACDGTMTLIHQHAKQISQSPLVMEFLDGAGIILGDALFHNGFYFCTSEQRRGQQPVLLSGDCER